MTYCSIDFGCENWSVILREEQTEGGLRTGCREEFLDV
jgi:hypothetical protein